MKKISLIIILKSNYEHASLIFDSNKTSKKINVQKSH